MIDSSDERPDPDSILRNLQVRENRKAKGSLKIFLGMAPGVGKTYTMLRTAHSLKNKGLDLVVGIIETHGRKDIEDLTRGLEILARKKLSYREKELEEFDVDAVYLRRPQLVLIDELAHTNAPGSRNNKRYLDVEEILNQGIDVFTTVNIQHLESRSQSVKEITGIDIRETVPDYFLDLADEIIVIDLPPEDLLKRLSEGLVYGKERGEFAKSNFFKKGNLTALRELTLRTAAERVDRDLRVYKQDKNITEVWKSGHRLLVGIFASPYAQNLIRATKRLAGTLDATWVGLYVEKDKELSDSEKALLVKNIDLVRELGGEVITTKSSDTVSGILRIAKQENITQIIIGKTGRSRLRNFLSGGSIESRLQRRSGNIDIYSVSTAPTPSSHQEQNHITRWIRSLDLGEFGWTLSTFLLTWTLASLLNPLIGYSAVGFVFLLSVCLAALFFSRFSVFVLAVLYALIHNYFFIPPLHTFDITRTEDFFMICMFFITAAIVGQLTSLLKTKEAALSSRELRALTLYHFTKELLKSKGLQEVANIGVQFIENTLHLDALLLARDGERIVSSGSFVEVEVNEKEKAVAAWVLLNGKHAGKFTQTLSNSSGYYLPLMGKMGIVGVLALKVNDIESFSPEQMTLLENFANQIVSAMDREISIGRAKSLDQKQD